MKTASSPGTPTGALHPRQALDEADRSDKPRSEVSTDALGTHPPPPKPLLTYMEVAEQYNLKRNTLYALVHQGRIPYVRIGKRLIRFSREDLENWIRAHTVSSKSASEGD
ncbi:MAG: helix-turn-helix domain-containing protein [Anaeromyxobacteraceae bacterium]